MTAEQWEARVHAVLRAAADGDPEPFRIFCQRLADMERARSPVVTPPAAIENVIGLGPQPVPPSVLDEPMAETEPEINPWPKQKLNKRAKS